MPLYLPDDLLSLTQVAAILRISRQRVSILVKRGGIASQRRGRRPVIAFSALQAFQATRRQQLADIRLRVLATDRTLEALTPDELAAVDAEIARLAYPTSSRRR